MYKQHYNQFINKNPDVIHMASHSHHYWPDVAISAHTQYATDSSALVDDKWDYFFKEVIPKSQKHISEIINFDRPSDITFASNTHELLYRIYSSIETKQIEILTSTDEFHSASRQFSRLQELENVQVKRFDLNCPEGQEEFKESISEKTSLIFLSHVFYNSGKVLDWSFIEEVVSLKNEHTLICIDAYHSFAAIPLNIKPISDKIFFMAGGYKYAQAGEGMCFMSLPKDCELRPKNTGWFASFETLDSPKESVEYSKNGRRFAGSTRDFSAHYRFNAVWDMFKEKNISICEMNKYITNLQDQFIKSLSNKYKLSQTNPKLIGRFITIEFESNINLKKVYTALINNNVVTDYRSNSLRFGFAPYTTKEEVIRVTSLLNKIELND